MSVALALALLFDSTCAVVCTYAIARGGTPERVGAAINMMAVGATWALRSLDAVHLAPADLAVLSIDVVVAGSFFWLGVTTIRFWPIWSAGFAVADLFMSLIGAMLPHVALFAYHTGLGIYAYLALGALALGTFRLPRDAQPYLRNGSRRSWIQHRKEMS